MSDLSAPLVREAAHARKERVHTTMLIELLVLMVFLAMAYAFVQKDEMGASRLQAQVRRLEADLREARKQALVLLRQNRELRDANETLRIALSQWVDRNGAISASEQPMVLPASQFEKLTEDLENQRRMVTERQTENASLRTQLAKSRGGGSNLPVCAVSPGYLFNIDLNGDGTYRVEPRWNAGAAPYVRSVTGAMALASGDRLSSAQFNRLAGQVRTWSLNQATPCTFRASYTVNHASLALYRRQLRTIARYFYVPVG